MLLKTNKNWKKYLNIDDEALLNKIIEDVAKYRSAYKTAEEVKIAQLWCALLDMEKKIQRIDKRMKRIEIIFDAIAQRMEEEKSSLIKTLREF
ncbi:MAG: hypothetical protein QXJ96_00665 [Candidatus Aenigmatarchaeota archaeon]|nr:hypothetical protein [Candidatus Aenigmarchaeota archaeon]